MKMFFPALIGLLMLLTACEKRPILPSRDFNTVADAASSGSIDNVRRAIERGKDVNLKNEHGLYALVIAAQLNDLEMIDLLLKSGANPNATCDNGSMALIYAAMWKNELMIRNLMKYGAQPYLKNNKGFSAIEVAREMGDSKVNRILEGAD